MSRPVYRLAHRFDPGQWQVAPLQGPPWQTVLAEWDQQDDPVDAGPDPQVQAHLVRALLRLGLALYADADPGADCQIVGRVPGAGLFDKPLPVVFATTPAALHGAFDATGAQWAMGAQWIVILPPGVGPGRAEVALLRTLFRGGALPPGVDQDRVQAILRAAVDGDAAAISAAWPQVLAAFAQAWAAGG